MYRVKSQLFRFIVARKDYDPVNAFYSVPRREVTLYEHITIKDNPHHDGNREFLFHVQGDFGVNVWVEICIMDDEWGRLQSFSINIICVDYEN